MGLILLSFLLSIPAPAAEMASTTTASFPWGGGWGAKSDTEIKSTLDKKSRTDGYELQSDASVSKVIGEQWGGVAGLAWKRERHEDLDYDMPQPVSKKKKSVPVERAPRFTSRNFVDAYYAGPTHSFSAWGRPVTLEVFYNRVGEDEDREKKGYGSYVTLDLKTKSKVNSWAKLKARYKYWEFLRTRGAAGTDTRQSRFELSPSLYYRAASLGLQNRVTHKFKVGSDRNYVEVAPFVKLEHKAFELTVRTIFTPFASADGRVFAENWAQRPVYSAELEVAL